MKPTDKYCVLYLQKVHTFPDNELVAPWINTFNAFASPIMLLESPLLEPTEVKEAFVRDWADEHGEDVYDDKEPKFKPYEIVAKFGIEARTTMSCRMVYKEFLHYLTTEGRLHNIYLPHFGEGAKDVRYMSTSDIDVWKDNEDMSHLTWKMKFKVASPNSNFFTNPIRDL